MNTYSYEYTDTFSGEANYCWVRRGKVTMPCLTHYGYTGSTDGSYSKANKVFERELVREVKARLGLTGIRARRESWGDIIVLRFSGTVLFIEYEESNNEF